MTPEAAIELMKAGGLPALILYIVISTRPKSEKKGDDPAQSLAEKINALDDKMNALHAQIAELSGYIKGQSR